MTAVREDSATRRTPVSGLVSRLPRLERVETPKSSQTLLTVYSAALTMIAIVLFTLIVNVTLISQLQHYSAQHRLYGQLRESLAAQSAPIGQLDINNNVTAPGTPIALITIPEIGVREVVVEGSSSRETKLGVGHRPDTPFPGQPGTAILYGRSAGYGGPFGKLDQLKAGEIFTVTTGQGTSTFRVVGAQNGDVKIPAADAVSTLQLITAGGPPFLPHGVRTVNAELISKVFARPPVAFGLGVLDHAETAMAIDPSRLSGLAWLMELLVIAVVAAIWAWKRWSHPAMWIVFAPVLAATGLLCADRITDLLPNLL